MWNIRFPLSAVLTFASVACAEINCAIIRLGCQVGAINGYNIILCMHCVSRSCLIKDLATGQRWTNIFIQLFINRFGPCKLREIPGRNEGGGRWV